MKRILYLSILLVMPLLLSADAGRSPLNGKWISPQSGNKIKIKKHRDFITVKGLHEYNRTYRKIGRRKYRDRFGNTIKINDFHDLRFKSECGNIRERYVKKDHLEHDRYGGNQCQFDDDGRGGYDDDYGNDGYTYYNGGNTYSDYHRNGRSQYGSTWSYDTPGEDRLAGQYFVREINETITIRRTRAGIKARRGNRDWVNYKQNRHRKNQYVDDRGNTYKVQADGGLRWKNKKRGTTLNLERR